MTKNIDRYQKLSPIDHVLHRPETYIGSIVTEEKEMTIINENWIPEKKKVQYNPGFLKIYDELQVNISDHYIRTNFKVKNIKITVEENRIILYNDGQGIPIEIHEKEKIYIPELIFGNMLTSENYNDNEKRFVGGRNGIGSKASNIYSTRFEIDCSDGKNSYFQVFSNNMKDKTRPIINSCNKSYTQITFYPDFKRFGLEKITPEIQSILRKRVLDLAMYCSNAKVSYNDYLIPLKSFKDYVNVYVKEQEIFYEKINEHWEIAITKSKDDMFEHVSLVNGIATYDGGTHVNYIASQISNAIAEQLQKKYKKSKINPNDIKRNLFLFINCLIPNPAFTSQTKEQLITKIANDTANVSEGFIKKIMNSEIIENIVRYIEAKELASLKATTKRNKKVKKLDDANYAGTSKSSDCNLFITEGDSAKSTILAGFSSVGRDYYGVFPVRGKLLNVRDVSNDKLKENEEIQNIVSALGLEFGKKYTSTKELRYGKVVFATDSDSDGYHIKGLLLNFFETFWEELLEFDFLYELVTPIVRATKDKDVKFFYKLKDYREFKDSENSKGYEYKYYKGLGTIESNEIKYFFKKIDKHRLRFYSDDLKKSKEAIDLVFNKKRADDRKDWLLTYDPHFIVNKFSEKTTIESFINREFIEFSMYDNLRSIPSLVDGLKPSQRKILYTFLKKNIKSDTKVSQVTGQIIDITSYHHGSVSIEDAIVSMAQDFVGSNNINLLVPKGQFGSRLQGGKDSSAPRYIYTKLNDLTTYLFNKEDEYVLNYNDDDGKVIEPEYYVPIIPTVLINGAKGIGTAYSVDIPNYNPIDIITYYENKLNNKELKELIPYYKNFLGKIKKIDNDKFLVRGKAEKINATTIKITELPIGMWTQNYYDILDVLTENKVIKDYRKNCSDVKVDIDVYISREEMPEFEKEMYSKLQLVSNISTSNMTLFDKNGKLRKYEKIEDILNEFYEVRIEYYNKRKEYILKEIAREILILKARIHFLNLVITNKIKIAKQNKENMINQLKSFKFPEIDNSYDYIMNMNFWNLTEEKIKDLESLLENKKNKQLEIQKKEIKTFWLEELDELKKIISKNEKIK